MYDVVQFEDGTREATLTVDGLTFKSRKYLDTLHPVHRVAGMDLRIVLDDAPGGPTWSAWDDNEFLAQADTAEDLLGKVRQVLVQRLMYLVDTYNSLFRLDQAGTRAKLSVCL